MAINEVSAAGVAELISIALDSTDVRPHGDGTVDEIERIDDETASFMVVAHGKMWSVTVKYEHDL